ncbi:MAG: D-aminoacyl-tRNA deacylase [Isosphaeraceae bacterium]|jgi:D-tyrosyl-tRNA(Tyr) deacylase|nr:MAG: D-aminoacyl-tRNA deacylase [Isosphaeraceae bacterium]
MRAVIQRVRRASVSVDGQIVSAIEQGWLVLLGVAQGDSEADADWLAAKVAGLRGFAAEDGRFDRDVTEVGGSVLVVSQFTLLADCRKGRRPSFSDAAPPDQAAPLYERFCNSLAGHGPRVERGVFQAHMEVSLVNDGPVTFLLESRGRS